MAQQVIARRYRPQTFDEVIGQDPIVRTLRNAIGTGRIAHGFIFSGHRGIGKTTIARILAKALNCRAQAGPTATPCGECESCREIREGNAVDVIEIDAASNRGIDEIRALRERARYRPARDRYKFFILDEAHQLTGDAFNALLKTLEEPPEWAVFVLATTEPEALPATIRSRCQHFAFRAVRYPVLHAHLTAICAKEKVEAEPDALGLIAEAGEGSVRDSLSLLDQAITHAASGGERAGLTAASVRELLGRVASTELRGLLEQVRADSTQGVLAAADGLLAAGVGPAQLTWQLGQLVRNALIAHAAPELLETVESERAAAAEIASWFGEEELTRFLQILLRTAGDLRHGEQERLHLELGLMKMLHARRLTPVEDVLAALGVPPAAAGPAPAASAAPAATRPALSAEAPAKPAPVAAAPAPPPPAAAPLSPTGAVLNALEAQGKASLAGMARKAAWRWDEGWLVLAFSGAEAGRAVLLQQPEQLKQIAAACRSALGRAVEVGVQVDEGAVAAATPAAAREAAAAPDGDTPEARAERHPLLRQIREQIPSHVIRTRALETK